jgi:hypothetical protein
MEDINSWITEQSCHHQKHQARMILKSPQRLMAELFSESVVLHVGKHSLVLYKMHGLFNSNALFRGQVQANIMHYSSTPPLPSPQPGDGEDCNTQVHRD